MSSPAAGEPPLPRPGEAFTGADGPFSPIAPVPVDETELAAMPRSPMWQYRVCGIGRAIALQGEAGA